MALINVVLHIFYAYSVKLVELFMVLTGFFLFLYAIIYILQGYFFLNQVSKMNNYQLSTYFTVLVNKYDLKSGRPPSTSKDELIFSVTKYVLTIFLTISSKQLITYYFL